MMMPRSAGHFFMYKDVLYTARAGAYEQCMYRMYGMPRAHGCAGAAMYRGMYGSKIVPYIYVQGSTVCRGRRTRSSDFDTSAALLIHIHVIAVLVHPCTFPWRSYPLMQDDIQGCISVA